MFSVCTCVFVCVCVAVCESVTVSLGSYSQPDKVTHGQLVSLCLVYAP